MFGKRKDGRRVKQIEPFQKIIPYIMKTRTDSMNFFEEEVNCAAWDRYIAEQRKQGIHLGYMHLMIASTVRLFALRPQLNRFVMRGRVFTRYKIWVSFVVHTSLRSDAAGTTVKLCFEGTEDLFTIARRIDEVVARETNREKESNATDRVAGAIMKIPGPFVRVAVNTLLWMDKHDMLPQAVMEASPFHTSIFLTNMKSLGINSIYHHVYEFGTTGFFVAMGKEKWVSAVENGELTKEKQMGLRVVTDERYCDGLYFARAYRLWRNFLQNPLLLEEGLAAKVEDCP